MSARTSNPWVLRVTIATLAVPVVLDLVQGGSRRLLGYLAADAFYYLTIARNTIDFGFVTFDQDNLTNGYHPFWQTAMIALLGVTRLFGGGDIAALWVVVLTNVAVLAVALVLLARAFEKSDFQLTPWFMTLPVGAYALLIAPLWLRFSVEELSLQNHFEGSEPLFGTLWSYVNGMESGAVVFMFALAAWYALAKPVLESSKHAAILGSLLGLFVLARLDHVFLPGGALAFAMLWSLTKGDRRAMRALSIASFAFGSVIALYMVINFTVFGSFLPVSGAAKSSFPHPIRNNFDLFAWVFSTGNDPQALWLPSAWRISQMVLPACFAAAYASSALAIKRVGKWSIELRDWAGPFDRILLLLTPGILALALYDWFFVAAFHQGHWYLPVSTLFVSLAIVRWLGVIHWQRREGRATVAIAITILTSVAFFLTLHRKADYHADYVRFLFDESPRVKAHFGEDPPKLFSYDDGIVAYSTGFPTMSGIGYALDVPAHAASEQNLLGDLAIARGYDHFTSLVYYRADQILEPKTNRVSRVGIARTWASKLSHPERYDYQSAYVSEARDFAIIRVIASER